MRIKITNSVGLTEKFTFQASRSVSLFTPLLEGLPKAKTAWFLPALLWSDYSGAACRIRRASDDAETDINFVNGILDEAVIHTFCGAGEGFIVKGYDQSGNSNDWIQTVSTLQPKIYDGTNVIKLGGFPAMWSDDSSGVQDNLSISITGSATTTAFHIIKTDRDFICINNSGNKWYGIAQNGDASDNYLSAGTPTVYINGSSIGGTRDNLYDNIINAHSINAFVNLDISTWTAFNTELAAFSAYTAPTYIQGAIIYSTDQSSNRTTIETALNNFLSIY